MRVKRHGLGFVFVSLTMVHYVEGGQRQKTPLQTSAPCEVTLPNGKGTFSQAPSPILHGNGALSVGLGWPDNIVVFEPGGNGAVLEDGSLSMKFQWHRGVHGSLKIEGHRLDTPAPPLRAHIPNGYGDLGLQSTALIFPTPGCWEVAGRVGDASLTFVTLVVKVGNGPVHVPR